MTSPENLHHPLLTDEDPWKDNSNSIWLGSIVTLNRNLEKFNFPGKLSSDKRKQIVSLLSREFLSSSHLKNPKLFRAEDIPPIEKEFFVEHFISNQSFHQAYTGEAFILDETGEFLAVLNLKDHILLNCIDIHEELESTWDRLVKIETELSKSINFAFSPTFGFLTSDPTECGTGLIITIFLHLPALLYTNTFDEVLKKNKDDSIIQTGLQGDPNDTVGDIVAFHNAYTLGVTEENIISSLRTMATKLIIEEKGIRQRLKQGGESEQAEFKDMVSRAYAILMHSYQIEAIEALNALSLLKMGLDFNWVKGITIATLNKLLFDSRRAHLLCHHGQKITQEELPHRRAEFIHRSLKGLELLI